MDSGAPVGGAGSLCIGGKFIGLKGTGSLCETSVPRTLPKVFHVDGQSDVGFRNMKLLGYLRYHCACDFDGRCRFFSARDVPMTKVVA